MMNQHVPETTTNFKIHRIAATTKTTRNVFVVWGGRIPVLGDERWVRVTWMTLLGYNFRLIFP